MNIIIYTLVILTIFYFLVRYISNISSKKISKSIRYLTILGLIVLAILFAVGGKYLLTLPLTLASLALLKLKGLSLFQLFSLFRLIQTLRKSGRFSFNQPGARNTSSISIAIYPSFEEAEKNLEGREKMIEIMNPHIREQFFYEGEVTRNELVKPETHNLKPAD